MVDRDDSPLLGAVNRKSRAAAGVAHALAQLPAGRPRGWSRAAVGRGKFLKTLQ